MGAVIVRHDEHGNPQVDTPTREFALLLGDRTILADTRAELVEALIPEYEQAAHTGAEEAVWLRYEFLAHLAGQLAEALAATATQQDRFDVGKLSEDEVNQLLQPGAPGQVPFTGHWASQEVPMLVLSVDYAPFTHLDRPTGNVRFLDSSTETTTIDTLVEAGLGELMVNEQPTAA